MFPGTGCLILSWFWSCGFCLPSIPFSVFWQWHPNCPFLNLRPFGSCGDKPISPLLWAEHMTRTTVVSHWITERPLSGRHRHASGEALVSTLCTRFQPLLVLFAVNTAHIFVVASAITKTWPARFRDAHLTSQATETVRHSARRTGKTDSLAIRMTTLVTTLSSRRKSTPTGIRPIQREPLERWRKIFLMTLSIMPAASASPGLLQFPGGQGPCLIFFKAISPMPKTIPGTWEATNKYLLSYYANNFLFCIWNWVFRSLNSLG